MHEVGEENRRRSYATMILTVDATLNMYMCRAENAVIRDCPETEATARVLDIIQDIERYQWERFPFRMLWNYINTFATKCY